MFTGTWRVLRRGVDGQRIWGIALEDSRRARKLGAGEEVKVRVHRSDGQVRNVKAVVVDDLLCELAPRRRHSEGR